MLQQCSDRIGSIWASRSRVRVRSMKAIWQFATYYIYKFAAKLHLNVLSECNKVQIFFTSHTEHIHLVESCVWLFFPTSNPLGTFSDCKLADFFRSFYSDTDWFRLVLHWRLVSLYQTEYLVGQGLWQSLCIHIAIDPMCCGSVQHFDNFRNNKVCSDNTISHNIQPLMDSMGHTVLHLHSPWLHTLYFLCCTLQKCCPAYRTYLQEQKHIQFKAGKLLQNSRQTQFLLMDHRTMQKTMFSTCCPTSDARHFFWLKCNSNWDAFQCHNGTLTLDKYKKKRFIQLIACCGASAIIW